MPWRCRRRRRRIAMPCSRCVPCANGWTPRAARASSCRATSPMLLVIGNKNYSSWSLRPWIALKMLGVPFDEKRIALRRAETKAEILRYSAAGHVPILRDGDTVVWDSLAILEYLAERHPQLWPADRAQRAKARAISAEMHSGFPHLREHMSMNTRKRYPGEHLGRAPLARIALARVHAHVLAQVGKAGMHLRRDRARLRALRAIGGPELRMALGQVFEDGERIPHHRIAVAQDGNVPGGRVAQDLRLRLRAAQRDALLVERHAEHLQRDPWP